MLVAETLKGIKRTHGTAPKQKAPVLTEDLRVMLRLVPDNLQGTLSLPGELGEKSADVLRSFLDLVIRQSRTVARHSFYRLLWSRVFAHCAVCIQKFEFDNWHL
jgi:hypothetical protein